MCVFSPFDILLPRQEHLERWPVIACDQFTSQPAYWQEAEAYARGVPSALHCILPEAELEGCTDSRYAQICRTMEEYLAEGIFRSYPGSFVYTERTLHDGSIRSGIVGTVDLEAYDSGPCSSAPVRATEKTVVERIPARMRIRRDAPLELSHVLLLCDDPLSILLGFFKAGKENLPCLYDLQLPQGGGRIRGWLVSGPDARDFEERLNIYAGEAEKRFHSRLLFAAGDGNHSLAAAKACYLSLKSRQDVSPKHLKAARYAMAELVNVREDSLRFSPIHRLVRQTDPRSLLHFLAPLDTPGGIPVHWITKDARGTILLNASEAELPVGILQDALDRFIACNTGKTDYIHGEEALTRLSEETGSIGFLLPPLDKCALFPAVSAGGVLPRKTFSMGEACEKRYYMEARKIRE